eukprot:3377873-Prorocentrum_lima.AAC.1
MGVSTHIHQNPCGLRVKDRTRQNSPPKSPCAKIPVGWAHQSGVEADYESTKVHLHDLSGLGDLPT